MLYLTLDDCLRLKPVDRLYYTHYVSIRDGMSSAAEQAIANLAVAFLSSGGGVVGTNDYLVQQQATPDNTVKVGTGRAYVPNSAGTMVYSTLLDATQNVTIGANSAGNPRIDSIVLYINLSASPDAAADNVAEFYDVQGTAASSPSAPTNSDILTAIGSGNPYIVLANVAVANGFTSITSANITDKRTTATLGGSSSSASTDGWLASNNTWVYASASTFTIAGVDLTAVFTKGTRIKFTQTTVQYGVVVSSSFSTNTTVTIAVNTDYTIANATITNPYYSYQVNPQGYPTWFNYTPTWSAGGSMTFTSVTNNIAKFAVFGLQCTLRIQAAGTTGGTTNTDVDVTVPINLDSTATYNPGGNAVVNDNNTGTKLGFVINSGAATGVVIRKYDTSNWGLGTTNIAFVLTYGF